jgi:hypothetical protein
MNRPAFSFRVWPKKKAGRFITGRPVVCERQTR